MRKVLRQDVQPGTVFYSGPEADAGRKTHPCLAVNSESMDTRLKKMYFGGAKKAWHIYVNNGDLTWNDWHREVWVD